MLPMVPGVRGTSAPSSVAESGRRQHSESQLRCQIAWQNRNFLLHVGDAEIAYLLWDRGTKSPARPAAATKSRQPRNSRKTAKATWGNRSSVWYASDGRRSRSRRERLPPAVADPPTRDESAVADAIVWLERLGA